MQIDRRAAKGLAPVGDCAIKMRVRDRDRLQPAPRADLLHGLRRRKRDAIPHHAAVGLLQQQRTLADCKARLDAYADNAEIIAQHNLVSSLKLLAREPLLSLPVHKLPLVLADRASGRRRGVFWKLRTALKAGPERHGWLLLVLS